MRGVNFSCVMLGMVIIHYDNVSLRASGLAWQTHALDIKTGVGQREVTAFFPFVNHTDRTVKIVSVQTSCGCTVGKIEKDRYAPNECGNISVVFTVGDRIGTQVEIVSVSTDIPGEAPTVLRLNVHISEEFIFDSRWVIWTVGEEAKDKMILCRALGELPIKSVKAHSTNPAIRVSAEPLETGHQYLIHVRPLRTDRQAAVLIEIDVEVPGQSERVFNLYAFIR